MPSGYTSDIYNGKEVTLRDYLMNVGRGMSMAIMQRDDDLSEPVKLRKISTYHFEQLEKALAEKERIESLSAFEIASENTAENTEAKHRWRKDKEEREAIRARYEAMLDQVRAWEPDPLVAYVKEYAERYLVESMEFDCPPMRESEPTRPGNGEWLANKRADVEWEIKYHTEQWKAEQERVEEFNEQIQAFLDSLPE